MLNMMLEIKNLNVAFDGQRVIEDLSFKVEKGESLAILGPNGSGKSTLLKAILGLIPFEGKVIWHGKPIISYLPERLSPQKFKEYPLTVREFFGFKKVSAEKVIKILEDVGLLDIRNILKKNPGDLSSGQFQRMLIAWSLVDEPEVLIFDEPTTGIDIGGEETIYSLLHRFWQEQGLTILLVTHEVEIVYAFSTNVLCLRKNKVCYGAPKDVLTPEMLQDLYATPIKFYKHEENHMHHHEHKHGTGA